MAVQIKNRKKRTDDSQNSNSNKITSLSNEYDEDIDNDCKSQKELNSVQKSDNSNLINGLGSLRHWFCKNNGIAHKNITNDEIDLLTKTSKNEIDFPLAITFRINIVVIILFLIAFGFRIYELDQPSSIVFDELHYGRFVSLYLRRTFFFDSQPPLGKQLIALSAYLSGYKGEFNNFTSIGQDYDANFPVRAFRFVPALCGSLLVPVIYQFVIEIGFHHIVAFFASFLLIFENSLLTQSRFILLDTILLFFSFFGLLSYLIGRKKLLFSKSWLFWNIIAALSLTCGVCVKYIGIFTLLQVQILSFWTIFDKLSDKTIKTIHLWLLLVYKSCIFIFLPILFYCFIFYIHLSVLIKAGPHDNIMTSAFQASLEGGLASIIRGQPREIAHGSQITLRNTHGRTCWLHSHQAVYPIRYPDKRGSSHQQQVTCYSFKDVNNWWIVKRPNVNDLITHEPLDKIKNGDIIQIVHGLTGRTLNSHDIASPMSPYNQEVSCYIDYNISMPAQNLWRVKLLNSDDTGDYWHAIKSRVQLIHINSSQALKLSGLQLPAWGHHQHEIVTDKQVNHPNAIWNVEEHRYTKNSDEKEIERELGRAEFVPLSPTYLSFWDKMFELQYKMLINTENIQNHIYSTDSPLDWPFLTKGIAYWLSPKSNAQIYLIGNIFLWYLGIFAMVAYWSLFLFYQLRRKRLIYDISEDDWDQFLLVGRIIAIGYLIHFFPYFFSEQTLFLHHYLPALMFKIILIPMIIGHLNLFVPNRFIFPIFIAISVITAYTFFQFLPFSYGLKEFSTNEIMKLKWRKTWHFLIHKRW
uniref:Protein O-mannosyltransferase 1 n=1 Tax=Dermatophagoides pteronyssinus TaxID=6956 RepID=A0A6P6XWY5_DERPT|nr:protein O-mannosyltransferase 1-like [Dermatophagoides pteronyssinus]